MNPWIQNPQIQRTDCTQKCYVLLSLLGASRWLPGKESACNTGAAGDIGWNPGLGRSSEVGHGNPLQYSCLENPMDRRSWRAAVHGVAKSRTQLSDSACMSVSPLSRLFSFFLYRGSNSVSPNDLAKVTQLVGGRVRTELCVCLSSTILLHTTQHTLITA